MTPKNVEDVINGLKHMADDHPCCSDAVLAAIATLEAVMIDHCTICYQCACVCGPDKKDSLSDTPETDSNTYWTVSDGGWHSHEKCLPEKGSWVPVDFASKLERERDEARFQLSAYSINPDRISQTEIAIARSASSRLVDLLTERDQLRKVCDELAQRLASIAEYHRGTPMSQAAQTLLCDTYNSLPHVIERTKAQ